MNSIKKKIDIFSQIFIVYVFSEQMLIEIGHMTGHVLKY